jgi:hypothetical protein
VLKGMNIAQQKNTSLVKEFQKVLMDEKDFKKIYCPKACRAYCKVNLTILSRPVLTSVVKKESVIATVIISAL